MQDLAPSRHHTSISHSPPRLYPSTSSVSAHSNLGSMHVSTSKARSAPALQRQQWQCERQLQQLAQSWQLTGDSHSLPHLQSTYPRSLNRSSFELTYLAVLSTPCLSSCIPPISSPSHKQLLHEMPLFSRIRDSDGELSGRRNISLPPSTRIPVARIRCLPCPHPTLDIHSPNPRINTAFPQDSSHNVLHPAHHSGDVLLS